MLCQNVFPNKKSFIVSTYEAFNKNVIPFGFFRDEILYIFSEDLHKEETTQILETDLIVLMKL